MTSWMAAYQRNGFGFHWPYQGDASRLRVDLPSDMTLNVTSAAQWTRRISSEFYHARMESGIWRNTSACTVITYLHGVEVASLPDRPHPGQFTLYGAALATIADYVAARGEASKADVLAGKWFLPATPETPFDSEDGNYLYDKRVSLKPASLTKNNSAYTVYFTRGRSGLYEVFKVRRYPGNPDQQTEDLPFTSH